MQLGLELSEQGFDSLPKNNPAGNAHIEGVLGSELRNFQAVVARVNDFLLYPFDFVSENECRLYGAMWFPFAQVYTSFGLFYCGEVVAIGP